MDTTLKWLMEIPQQERSDLSLIMQLAGLSQYAKRLGMIEALFVINRFLIHSDNDNQFDKIPTLTCYSCLHCKSIGCEEKIDGWPTLSSETCFRFIYEPGTDEKEFGMSKGD